MLVLGCLAAVASTRLTTFAPVRPIPVPRWPLILLQEHGAALASDDATWRQAVADLERDDERRPSPSEFDEAILACSRAQPPAWEAALEVFQKRSAAGLAPRSNTFAHTMWACARAGEADRVMKLLSQMKATGVRPDTHAFHAALHAARVSKQWRLAKRLLQQMGDRDVERGARAYGAAIAACRRGGAPASEAVQLLDEASAADVRLSQETLVEVLCACAATRGGGTEHGERVWCHVVEACGRGDGGDGGDGGGDDTDGTWGTLSLRACNGRLYERGTASDWQAATALLQQMREGQPVSPPGAPEVRPPPPDLHSLNLVARACGRAGAWEAAVALFESCAATYGLEPSERMLCSAMQACTRAGRVDDTLRLLERAEANAAGPAAAVVPGAKAYGAAVHAVAYSDRDGRSDECLALLGRMEAADVAADVGVYNAVVHACQAAEDWTRVHELLYQMRGSGLTSPDTFTPWHRSLWKHAKRELGL